MDALCKWMLSTSVSSCVLVLGVKEFVLPRSEKYPVFYHQENSSAIYVGGEGRLYYYDFATSENYTVRMLCWQLWPPQPHGKVALPAARAGLQLKSLPRETKESLCSACHILPRERAAESWRRCRERRHS